MSAPRAGIRDVARVAGVSIGTVSTYLNHPERVAAATSVRIAAAIDELGFIPSGVGRQLRLGVSSVIGYIAPEISNPHYAEVAESVQRRAAELGLSVLLADSRGDAEVEDAYLDAFARQNVRGLIVGSFRRVEERLLDLRRRGTPSVLMGQAASSSTQPSVAIDDESGGRQAVAHLVEVGCRRLAFVGGPASIPRVGGRLAGARDEAARLGIPLEHIDTPDRTIEGGRAAAAVLADRAPGDRPDGVFAVNDLVALGILQEATGRGIRVPVDLALVGFDDNRFAAASLVPLSSVRGTPPGLGASAVDLLLDPAPAAPHLVFDPVLVPRVSSTGFGSASPGR